MKVFTNFVLTVTLFVGFFVTSAQATLVLPVSIHNIAKLSEHIFIGTCIGRKTELDEYESGQMVTWYTFRVDPDDWIKGESWTGDEMVVWKQLAQGNFKIDGQAVHQNFHSRDFEVGKEYWVALPKPSSVGLLFPLGLSQGSLEVQTDENGARRLPELKSRMKFLQHGLDKKKSSKNLFLKSQVNTISDDDSVDNFKAVIQSAMDD